MYLSVRKATHPKFLVRVLLTAVALFTAQYILVRRWQDCSLHPLAYDTHGNPTSAMRWPLACSWRGGALKTPAVAEEPPPPPPCFENDPAAAAAMADTLVVLKTGATEAPSKLPIHFTTTLRCVPDYIIFSDLDEHIAGHHVHDVLSTVSASVRRAVPEFSVYELLRNGGRAALDAEQVRRWKSAANTDFGMMDNPAWRLDKWKFLPMLRAALRHRDDAKWYVFIEADTFVFWRPLLRWLARFEHSQPWYLGSQMQIGDVVFAHGGSGFALSHRAIHMAVAHIEANIAFYDDFTAEQWAGDCVLGKALRDAGVGLHYSWPALQEQPVDGVDFGADRDGHRLRCYHALTYHHMDAAGIQGLAEFEAEWTREQTKNTSFLRHGDVQSQYIIPALLRLTSGSTSPPLSSSSSSTSSSKLRDPPASVPNSSPYLEAWDNLSETEVPRENVTRPIRTPRDCENYCGNMGAECVQFSFTFGGGGSASSASSSSSATESSALASSASGSASHASASSGSSASSSSASAAYDSGDELKSRSTREPNAREAEEGYGTCRISSVARLGHRVPVSSSSAAATPASNQAESESESESESGDEESRQGTAPSESRRIVSGWIIERVVEEAEMGLEECGSDAGGFGPWA